jgi:hypothetical protein
LFGSAEDPVTRVIGEPDLTGVANPPPLCCPDRPGNTPIPINLVPCYTFPGFAYLTPKGALTMEWVTPEHEEINLNCEISSYANAEL